MPRVVWAGESKNVLGFEIGPSYDDVPTTSQRVTDGKSNCTSFVGAGKVLKNSHSSPHACRLEQPQPPTITSSSLPAPRPAPLPLLPLSAGLPSANIYVRNALSSRDVVTGGSGMHRGHRGRLLVWPGKCHDPAPTDHKKLMRNFKSVASSTSADLLQNVLRESMCLERADKGCIKGAVSDVRKATYLVGR